MVPGTICIFELEGSIPHNYLAKKKKKKKDSMLEKLLKTIDSKIDTCLYLHELWVMSYECKCVTCLNEIIYVHLFYLICT